MIVFPSEFVLTKWPGYYWNTTNKKLYSIKVGGVLKPLVYSKGGTFNNHICKPGFPISVNGVRQVVPLEYLNRLVPKTGVETIGVQQ